MLSIFSTSKYHKKKNFASYKYMHAEFKARKEKEAKNVVFSLSCYELTILQTGEKDELKNSCAEETVFCNNLGNALS